MAGRRVCALFAHLGAHGQAGRDGENGPDKLGDERAEPQQVGDMVAVEVGHDEGHAGAG
jgi:hypothetical protein